MNRCLRRARPFGAIETKVGWLDNCYYENGKIFGDLFLNPYHPMTPTICWAAETNPNWCSLSHNVLAEQEKGNVVTRIDRVLSVDIVLYPATTKNLKERIKEQLEVRNADMEEKEKLKAAVLELLNKFANRELDEEGLVSALAELFSANKQEQKKEEDELVEQEDDAKDKKEISEEDEDDDADDEVGGDTGDVIDNMLGIVEPADDSEDEEDEVKEEEARKKKTTRKRKSKRKSKRN